MAVKVRGKNIEVTQALKDYVEKRVQTITKQFKTVGEITAVMRVEKGNHTVEITVPASGIVQREITGREHPVVLVHPRYDFIRSVLFGAVVDLDRHA